MLAAAWLLAAGPGIAQDGTATADALARSIVEKADLVRFPGEGFEVSVTIRSQADADSVGERRYKVLSKGNENTVVMVTAPASERGQIMLMKGRDLWVFLPNVSQPVRLPLAQRLTGQVANGDIARANFSGDYHPRVLRTERVGSEDAYVLELSAIDRGVTYHRVVYWVKQSNHWPLRAEFYSVSDRLLKTCAYENYQRLGGRLRPTRLVMRDALRRGEETVMEYSDMRTRNIPDKVFTKDFLKRLD